MKNIVEIFCDTINTLKWHIKDLGDLKVSEPTEQKVHGENYSRPLRKWSIP